jgi:hypothetical protein
MGHQFRAVAVYRGDMGSAVELDKVPLPPECFVDSQAAAVAADHLIAFMVGIVQGHFPDIMGNPNLLSPALAKGKAVKPLGHKLPLRLTKAELHGIVLLMFHF